MQVAHTTRLHMAEKCLASRRLTGRVRPPRVVPLAAHPPVLTPCYRESSPAAPARARGPERWSSRRPIESG